jgi:hypothetical protein
LQPVVDKAQKLLGEKQIELDQIFQIDKIREISKKLDLPVLFSGSSNNK